MSKPRTMAVSEFRSNLATALRAVTEARECLIVATKGGSVIVSPIVPAEPAGATVSAMPTILDAAGRRRWGFYSREETKMHLQTQDEKRPPIKVWLENAGRRCFEWAPVLDGGKRVVNELTGRDAKDLRAQVTATREEIEREWCQLMVRKGWASTRIKDDEVLVVAYPGTPHSFTRRIQLLRVFPAMSPGDFADWVSDFDPIAGALRIGPVSRAPKRRDLLELSDYMFTD